MINKELKAMTSLLGDRSVKIRNRVATKIEEKVSIYRDDLNAILMEENDPLVREKIRLILSLSQSEDARDHWRILRENLSFNLRDGFIAISLLDFDTPPGRLQLLKSLDTLADEWLRQCPVYATPDIQVENLMAFLFTGQGFRGNEEDYYSLDNCFLHRVLSSRKGISISLCLLAILLAEEAGLPLYGIGLPLHFIVGHFQGPKGIRFFDCFDRGREVTPEECVSYLHSRGIFFHPQLLSPSDTESTLTRVLVNLKHICQRGNLTKQLDFIDEMTGGEGLRVV